MEITKGQCVKVTTTKDNCIRITVDIEKAFAGDINLLGWLNDMLIIQHGEKEDARS